MFFPSISYKHDVDPQIFWVQNTFEFLTTHWEEPAKSVNIKGIMRLQCKSHHKILYIITSYNAKVPLENA